MKGSLLIVAFFTLGVILGVNSFMPDWILSSDISNYVLYLLMFLVGIGIGMDKEMLSVIKKAKLKVVLVPLIVIVGTFLGVSIVALLLSDLDLKDALAIGSGFGYYSLSSIIITKVSGEFLGVIALVSNVMREIITLLLSPFLAKYFGKLAPIASGGATSMDTTLPIITQTVGKQYAIISVFSGIVLTILVPFLVSLICEL